MGSAVRRNRAFTFVPLVVLLAVSMVGLGIVIALKAPPRTTPSAAYNSGYQVGAFVGPILIASFFVWIASRIAERRSEAMATAIVGTILLLCNIAYGVNALRAFGVIKPLAAKQGLNPSSAGSLNANASPAVPPQTGAAPSPATEPQTGTPTPAVVAPDPGAPSSSPTTTATPSGGQPLPRGVPRQGVPAKAAPDANKQAAEQEAAAKALDGLREEVVGECLLIATRAETAFGKMRKPVTTKSALDKSMQEFATLKGDAEKLEKRLRNLMQEAKERLSGGVVDQFDAQRMAMDWERGLATFERSNACAHLGRTCETAQELFVVLKDTLGKWKVDASGKVTSPDRNVEQRLFSPRAQLGFALDRQEETLNDLRQGGAARSK